MGPEHKDAKTEHQFSMAPCGADVSIDRCSLNSVNRCSSADWMLTDAAEPTWAGVHGSVSPVVHTFSIIAFLSLKEHEQAHSCAAKEPERMLYVFASMHDMSF